VLTDLIISHKYARIMRALCCGSSFIERRGRRIVAGIFGLGPPCRKLYARAVRIDRNSRGDLPSQRRQAWLNELASSKPRSQAISEMGMPPSSR
jgi:hypothetical protein